MEFGKTTVFCTLQVEGVHRWENCGIPEVGFLKHPHRHVFGITCWKEVSHDDRDVEFILLKRRVLKHLLTSYADTDGVCQFGARSCEMIAKELCNGFGLCKCRVDEDGENGAEVEAA